MTVPTDYSQINKMAAEIERLRTAAQCIREQTIEECAQLMQRWSDEAAEFQASERCRIQGNVCRNAAQAIRNLSVSSQVQNSQGK